MKKIITLFLPITLLFLTLFLVIQIGDKNLLDNKLDAGRQLNNTGSEESVRAPAVAGTFYPVEERKLDAKLSSLLAKAGKIPIARQRGADTARGNILAFTDADALVPKTWLDSMVGALEEDPQRIIVTGDTEFYDKDGCWYLGAYDYLKKIFRTLDGPLSIRGANMIIRTDDLREIGGFDMRVLGGGDDCRLGKQLGNMGSVYYHRSEKATVAVSPRRIVKGGVRSSLHHRFPRIIAANNSGKYNDLFPAKT